VPAPQPINVNQLLIRPLFVRIGVAVLLVLPLVVWRLSPNPNLGSRVPGPGSRVPDLLSRFGAALIIYLLMLLVTTTQVGLLFMYGRPEWPSILTAYLGLLLFGLAFISLGFLISVIVTQPVAAIGVTAALGLLVAAATWLSLASPTVPLSGLRYFSMADRLDDFAKGVIDTGNVIFYVSLIAVSLLLATRSLKSLWRT
jgi:ABC-2 type transport system permease protein